jgi:hypothetical protein
LVGFQRYAAENKFKLNKVRLVNSPLQVH